MNVYKVLLLSKRILPHFTYCLLIRVSELHMGNAPWGVFHTDSAPWGIFHTDSAYQ